jgi:hypothetical protein
MKTTNYFRNAALAAILVMTASFTVSHSEKDNATSLNREKTEFANAGYWIDAVVVTGNTKTSDEELLAGKGYYIEPVVVTYDTDRSLMAGKGYYIEPVVVTAQTGTPMHVYAAK